MRQAERGRHSRCVVAFVAVRSEAVDLGYRNTGIVGSLGDRFACEAKFGHWRRPSLVIGGFADSADRNFVFDSIHRFSVFAGNECESENYSTQSQVVKERQAGDAREIEFVFPRYSFVVSGM